MAESNFNALLALSEKNPKPAAKPVPMTGNGMGKGMTNKGMKSGNAMKPPEVTPVGDYMGLAFDASVRKGKDAARAYLLAKMKRDGRSETVIQDQLKQFDLTIGKQESLKSDQGLGEGVVNAYRDKSARKGMTPSKAQDYALNQKRISETNASIGRAKEKVGNALNVMGRQGNIPF
jgi:hypothetical protein